MTESFRSCLSLLLPFAVLSSAVAAPAPVSERAFSGALERGAAPLAREAKDLSERVAAGREARQETVKQPLGLAPVEGAVPPSAPGTGAQAHALAGDYRSAGGLTLTIDAVGRVTPHFYLTVGNPGVNWRLVFPHRLKADPDDAQVHSTKGYVEGLWTGGVRCEFPATMTLDAFESALDMTMKIPQNFYANCAHTGSKDMLESFDRVKTAGSASARP